MKLKNQYYGTKSSKQRYFYPEGWARDGDKDGSHTKLGNSFDTANYTPRLINNKGIKI